MTDIGESVNVSQIPDNPDKYLRAEVIEISFQDNYKTAHEKATVTAPHWPAEEFKFSYSKKPAVFAFGQQGSQKAEVKLKIDSKNVSGTGKLIGSFRGLIFEGSTPLASGEHSVSVTLQEPPDALEWVRGSASWGIEGGGFSVSAGTTQLELFFVFDDPAGLDFFSADGVWAEALRFLFKKGAVRGEDNQKDAVAKVAECCFSLDTHKYDLEAGRAFFGGFTGNFKLADYMGSKKDPVNCYDQTYAIIVFAGALGIAVDGLYLEPFGFLNETDLVGWGRCNNPFPGRKYNSEKAKVKQAKKEDYLVVSPNDPYRMPFGNHMFCEMQNSTFDACAGPAKGALDRKQYLLNNIDTTTLLNEAYKPYGFRPGTVSDIRSYNSVNATVKSVE